MSPHPALNWSRNGIAPTGPYFILTLRRSAVAGRLFCKEP